MPLLSQTVLLAVALAVPLASAAAQGWQPAPSRRDDGAGRNSHGRSVPDAYGALRPHDEAGYGGLQLDATALLEAPPQQSEAAPRPPSPMFSRGWTRDGFGGQPAGWR